MNEILKEKLKRPDYYHRSMPFWSWNDKLDKEEIIWQIHQMNEAGVGGFFLHSRDGLETDYMGDEWKECIRTAVQEAEKLGMYVWLYDEDRWPSGTAGGIVPAMGDAYRCKGLCLEICKTIQLESLVNEKISGKSIKEPDCKIGLTAVYAALIDNGELMEVRRVFMAGDASTAMEDIFLEAGETLLAVRLLVSGKSQWFNNEAPPDQLNPRCVDEFISHTHETYKVLLGSSFGTTVPGIFTDEPSLHDRHTSFGEKQAWIPWTFGFSSYFKEKNGYDFFDFLPFLYFQGKESRKIRHDYWHTLAKRFGESYFMRIGDWCEKNGFYFTGHLLQEDKMGLSTRVNGGIMSQYRYQHVPGIDMLCQQIDEAMTVKQCTSVANQLNKPFVISEMYGCTGWDFTLEGQKWMGDWQYVLGVTRRCQHLALYSLRGCRKRDYPPSFHYNTTWWKENCHVEDYFARLGTVLEEGKPIRKILLLHPLSTVWSLLGVDPYGNPIRRLERDIPALNEYGEQFNEFLKWLLGQHFDCDLGDEMLIQEFGEVRDGKFYIGSAGYDAVVIPQGDTFFRSTYQLFTQFMDIGSTVYLAGRDPFLTEGSADRDPLREQFLRHQGLVRIQKGMELSRKLEPFRTVSIVNLHGEQDSSVLYQLRKTDEGYVLFVVNTDRYTEHAVEIRVKAKGIWNQVDLLTGEWESVAINWNPMGESGVTQVLSPCDSRLFVISYSEEHIICESPSFARVDQIFLGDSCPVTLSGPNILTLDRCSYRLEGVADNGTAEVWQVQEEVRKRLSMTSIARNGIEQRYRWVYDSHPSDGKKLELIFTFNSDIEANGCSLILERPEDFQLYMNGKLVKSEPSGWYLDRSFKKISLPKIRQGENEIRLCCHYRNNMELEAVYIIGDFGVSEMRTIIPPVRELKTGDWCGQGLFHYCGSVIYHYETDWNKEGDQILLSVKAEAACLRLEINGHSIPVPWLIKIPVEITGYMQPGHNNIEIELVGTPRNMLGPFHTRERHPALTNDACFTPDQDDYYEGYQLTFYGMKESPVIDILLKEGDKKHG